MLLTPSHVFFISVTVFFKSDFFIYSISLLKFWVYPFFSWVWWTFLWLLIWYLYLVNLSDIFICLSLFHLVIFLEFYLVLCFWKIFLCFLILPNFLHLFFFLSIMYIIYISQTGKSWPYVEGVLWRPLAHVPCIGCVSLSVVFGPQLLSCMWTGRWGWPPVWLAVRPSLNFCEHASVQGWGRRHFGRLPVSAKAAHQVKWGSSPRVGATLEGHWCQLGMPIRWGRVRVMLEGSAGWQFGQDRSSGEHWDGMHSIS